MRRLAFTLGAAVALLGHDLHAQLLRGEVRDSVSRQGVSGAVIVVRDSAGTTLVRGISDAEGAFRVLAPAAARRVQVIRMGFRPVELPSATFGTSSAPVVVTIAPIPTLLSGVTVTASDGCPRRSDRSISYALLGQARAGLLATVVAREANPALVLRIAFERTLDANGDRIVRQKVQLQRDSTAVSFNAAHSASDLAKRGFMFDSAGVQTYFGPDADVLLDEGFAASYCFHLAASAPERPTEVGLAFAPRTTKSGRVDIVGTLWVDTASRVLRDVEFTYLGVDRLSEGLGAGGRVSFREMFPGVVLVDRWHMRVVGRPDSVGRPSGAARPSRVYEIREFGGELARARWGDGRSWQAPLGTLQLDVRHGDGAIAPGTAVRLLETNYRGVADSSGRVVIRDLVPGPYAVTVVDPRLAPLGVALPTAIAFSAARDSLVRAAIAVPTAEDFVSQACRTDGKALGPAWLIARIGTEDDAPVEGARWRLSRERGGGWATIAESGVTGGNGLLHLCRGLAVGETVRLEAWRPGELPTAATERISGQLTAMWMRLPRQRTLAMRAGSASARPVTVRGTVVDSLDDTGVAEAFVSLIGTPFAAFTDSTGRFALSSVPEGDYQAEVHTPMLDSIGALHRATLQVRGPDATVRLRLPTPAQFAAVLCGATRASGADASAIGALVGRVDVTEPAARRADMRVVAEWTLRDGDSDRAVARWASVRTDRNGTFRLCGVPVSTPLSLRAEFDSASAFGSEPAVVVVPAERSLARADLTLQRATDGEAAFTGVVLAAAPGAAAVPVRGAEVSVDGVSRPSVTDADGRFRLSGVGVGTRRVHVRHAVHASVVANVEFGANQIIEHRIELIASAAVAAGTRPLPPPVAASSATAAAEAAAASSAAASAAADATAEARGLATFEAHRRLGTGKFMTRAELTSFDRRPTADVLSSIPGLFVTVSGSGRAWIVGKRAPSRVTSAGGNAAATDGESARCVPGGGVACALTPEQLREQGIYCPEGVEATQGVTCACYARVYVDGQLVNRQRPTEPFDVNSVPPDQIEGLEVYTPAASPPAEYRSSTAQCGVLVIWTRRRT